MDKKKGKTSEIIILAEGVCDTAELARTIEKCTGIAARASILGYIQRGGAPTARSRNMGTRFGSYAVDLIRKSVANKVVVIKKGVIKHINLSTARRPKGIDKALYFTAQRVAS